MPRVGKLMDRKRLSRPKYSVQYTPSGHIDVGRTLAVLRDSHVPDLELIAMLRAVWAEVTISELASFAETIGVDPSDITVEPVGDVDLVISIGGE